MARFERSELTKSLVRYLAEDEKGARVPHVELSQAVGAAINSRHACLIRPAASSNGTQIRSGVAFRRCRRLAAERPGDRAASTRLVFVPCPQSTERGRVAGRCSVHLDHLNVDEQSRFAVSSIIREVAREALSKAVHRRVEKVARGTSNDLPSFNAVEWMISLSPRRSKNA